jgi:hypothetical protein
LTVKVLTLAVGVMDTTWLDNSREANLWM